MFKAWWVRLGPVLAVATMLAGWSLAGPAPDVDASARTTYDQVRRGDPALEARFVPELRTPAVMTEMARVKGLLPPGEPRSVKPVFWNATVMTGAPKKVFVRHLYDYGDTSVLTDTTLVRDPTDKTWLIFGFHAQIATREEMRVNDFTLQGKKPGQYAFLAATALSPLLMIAALIVAIRRRNLKWKWLWCILAFFGLFSFSMNWTDGQIDAQWATLQLIGAGITSDGTGFTPWFLKFTVPLGALLILTGVWAKPRKPKPEGTPS